MTGNAANVFALVLPTGVELAALDPTPTPRTTAIATVIVSNSLAPLHPFLVSDTRTKLPPKKGTSTRTVLGKPRKIRKKRSTRRMIMMGV